MYDQWGDKGCVYDPSRCDHAADDGCMWCCMTCNLDRHLCPHCGTISNHKQEPCNPCIDFQTGEMICP